MGRTKFSTSTSLALAAVLLSSSTTVYALAALPKHSVGKKQLKTSAVTNKKLATHAVTGSKVASNTLGGTQIKESALGTVPNASLLQGKGAASFVGAPRLAFGTGNANSTAVATVLSLPSVGATVTTDGDTDTDPEVIVNLPSTAPTFGWVINSTWESQTFSSMGGAIALEAQTPVVASGATATSREFTAHIWRSDGSAGIFLHCAFDTDGFTTSRPFTCWAMST